MSWDSPGWKPAAADYAKLDIPVQRTDKLKVVNGGGDPRADIPPATSPNEFTWSPPTTTANIEIQQKLIEWLDMSNWDSEPVPERKWAIKDRVPLNQAGLFSGEGGAGKSIIELMKDVAHVVGRDWLGSLPEIGPAFYIGAEDDKDELHIRLAAIAKHHETTFDQTNRGRIACPMLARSGRNALCRQPQDGQGRDNGAL